MIKCPGCGYENVDGTQFCEGCGEELPANGATAAPAATAAAGGDQTIKCPACDNLNPAENVVCEVCGTELRGGQADAGQADPFAMPAAGSTTPFDAALNTTQATPPATGMATVPDADTSANVANTADAPAPAANAADPFTTPASNAAPTPDAISAAVATSSDATAPAVGGASSGSSALGGSAPSVTDTGAGSIPDLAAPATSATGATPAAGATAVGVTSAGVTAAGGGLQPGQVKLTVEQGMSVGKQFVLGDSEMQVGREDEEEGIYPDIDLSDQDEGYVHRRHATLNFTNGQLTVTHLGGANKTRVNNRPLPDNQAQPINIGDKVAFGKVVLRVQPHP